MSHDLYMKLVDLYAGGELPKELEDELKAASIGDKELSHEMATLRHTVDLLHSIPEPEFTEESFQRVLMSLYARGVEADPKITAPAHMQLYLPIAG
ncbi:MAG TPA: hypothetical protein PKA27_07405 [Fimbriimonadaceae bacterium]|nr:hypothetical protein [Fimbriimonadaceae bacterium]